MKFPTGITKAVSSVGKCIKTHSPQIAMVIGTGTSILAIVEAVKQTPKAMRAIEEHKDELEVIKTYADNNSDEDYTDRDYKIDVMGLCGRTGIKLVKIYAMPLAMEAASLACFFGAHKILNDRNKMLSAALATMTDAYNSYRNRVIEAVGEEKEEQIRLGTTKEKITKEIVDENGKVKKITEKVDVIKNPLHLGPYDILWEPGDPGYDQSPKQREYFVASIANTYTKFIYEIQEKDYVSLTELANYFKKQIDANHVAIWKAAEYTQKDDDQAVLISMKDVCYPDPDMPGFYRDATILTFNIQNNMLERLKKEMEALKD